MMMALSLGVYLYLLFIHLIADFFLQPDHIAKGKSSNLLDLTLHVLVYTFALGVGMTLAIYVMFGAIPPAIMLSLSKFLSLNFVLHWGTDYVTSRATSGLFKEGRHHEAFCVIGIDQFLHQVALAATLFFFLLA